jgi:LmbE family N-acetylglucosaminyl deacetylase
VSAGPFTLLAVHAHPDDESSGTGGLLRLAAEQGHCTILVTCTNGELGEVHASARRLDPRYNPAHRRQLAHIRRAELAKAAAVLGLTHLYMLGYHDSGMHGWETTAEPQAFVHANLEEAAARLGGIIRAHRPHVMVTYDTNGGYGHPDHIMAHRVTVAALAAAADAAQLPTAGLAWHVQKLYYTAWSRSEMLRVFKALHLLGRKTPLRDPDFDPSMLGCPDELITTRVDVRPVMRTKWRALFAHRSQMGQWNFFWWFLRLTGRWLYPYESFCCAQSTVPIKPPEKDIFAGL